jgi:colanic acid/amylovoran biosynthesis glycosyltransferase
VAYKSPGRMPTPIGFLRHNFLVRSETFIYNSMRSLEDHGAFNVRVFALKRFLADRFPWDDVTVLHGLPRVWYHITRRAPEFARWSRSVKLIHAHLGQTGPFAMAGAARANVPFVVSYYGHDVMLHRTRERFAAWAWWYTLLRKRVLARAAKILVLSDQMRRALEAQGCPPEKIEIVRLGVDLARFDVTRTTPPSGPLRVLMVGREVDKKGFDDGIRACKALVDRGIPTKLTLLGTGGPLQAPLRALAAELSLDVAWPEPASSVPEAMANADVLLVPSRVAANGDEEGTPTVIVEGGAARLPIVSTRHAGIPEQIDDGTTGILAAERDIKGLADGLAALANDPAKRVAMGEAARAKMQREYSLAAHRDRLEHIYRSVLGESANEKQSVVGASV